MNNIASERQSLGLTQEQLALMFGWRQSRIYAVQDHMV